METTTLFCTSNKNNYLYDYLTQQIINIHPVMELIHSLNGCVENSYFEIIMKQYPDLSEEDILFYIDKYYFLKKSGFWNKYTSEDSLSARLSSQMVENQIYNLNHVLFQVTSDCNLQCKYCCYGEFYKDSSSEVGKELSFEQAKNVIDYLIPYWNSNISHNSKIVIGFYGGEPLVNFELIEEIVEYVKGLKLENKSFFTFNMTTNAFLLDKYMDYLVENKFSLLISLDGDKMHDYLRVDKGGHPTFDRVYRNVKELQFLHYDYFKSNVEFNSLLNNRSTPEEIYSFIVKEFGKVPMIGEISTNALKDELFADFMKIYKPYEESDELRTKMSSKSLLNKKVGFFFYYHLLNSYRQYYELLLNSKRGNVKIPTGTCLPFWKKMFVAATGNIYACERIGFEYTLGYVDKQSVNIDFEYISELYNQFYNNIMNQCSNCYLANYCSECLFQFEMKNKIPICKNRYDLSRFENYLSSMIDVLENDNKCFDDINKMTFA